MEKNKLMKKIRSGALWLTVLSFFALTGCSVPGDTGPSGSAGDKSGNSSNNGDNGNGSNNGDNGNEGNNNTEEDQKLYASLLAGLTWDSDSSSLSLYFGRIDEGQIGYYILEDGTKQDFTWESLGWSSGSASEEGKTWIISENYSDGSTKEEQLYFPSGWENGNAIPLGTVLRVSLASSSTRDGNSSVTSFHRDAF